jgi:mannose-6-phosphate isomerase-like protein (cupin superfamily)
MADATVTYPYVVKKEWGHEEILTPYFKKMHLDRGAMCSLHRHAHKTEAFYLLEGIMMLEVQDRSIEPADVKLHKLLPGACHELPAGTWHRFMGVSQCVFLEACTPKDDPSDCERLTHSIAAPKVIP